MFTRALIALTFLYCSIALAQTGPGTGFTYQGQLTSGGSAANASADFHFRLYDSLTSGSQIGNQIAFNGVPLTNGVFTVALDFGVSPYAPNAARYLEIDTRSPSGVGAFVTVLPRQLLAAAPFALNTRGVFVDANGNVGVGTTPANRFHVLSNGDTQCTLNIDSGVVAAQVSQLRFSDRGTAAWTLSKFADNSFSVRESAVTADRMTFLPGGNVGIGTSSPGNRLEVQGSIRVSSGTTSDGATVTDFDTNGPRFTLRTGAEAGLVYLSRSQSAPSRGGQMLVCDTSGAGVGGITMTGLEQSTMFATVKSFKVPNPDDAKSDLWYACVEGPEAAMYVRGTAQLVHGRATVPLPRHFAAMLSSVQSMTVQVTPSSADCRGLAVTRKGAGAFDVVELMQGQSEGSFDWEVKAVRKGFENYQVVRPKDWLTTPHDGE